MLIHAPVVDPASLLPSRLWSEKPFPQPALLPNRQASRSETGWLTNFQMSRFAFNCLPPPTILEVELPVCDGCALGKELLLLLGHWLPVLTTVPEVSSHSNPWGMHLHLFLQGMFFLTLCSILWAATVKSWVNVTCTFLVNEEWSSSYRSWLCCVCLFIPLTDRHGALWTRLSPECM